MYKFTKSLYVDVRIEESAERIITFTLAESPHYVHEVVERLNLPESTVSQHLTFSFDWT